MSWPRTAHSRDLPLAIRERVLGPDHPDTVATRHALAELAAEADAPATDG
jgi:hypothetical protein